MQQWLHRLVLVLVSLAAGAAVAAQPLRVGTAADLPPITFQAPPAEGGAPEVVGIEADFARVLASQLGRPLQWRVLPREGLLAALARGEVDIVMSGLPLGEGAAAFTRPYLRSGLMALIRTDDVMRFRGPAALLQGGYRAGFVAGGPAAGYVARELAEAQAVPLDSAEAGLQALLAGRIDVLIEPAATSWRIATDPRYGDLLSLNRLLTEEQLAWAVRSEDGAFRARVDQELERMRQTGVLTHILDRWIPVAPE